MHPVVNSLESITNGIPQISTRDTQTVVHLKNNQTLVIGGLIEESVQKTINKLPVLSNIPLIGGLFKNSQISSTRNELIIVVTPHVLAENEMEADIGPKLPAIPKPGALPKLPANSRLPAPSGQMPSVLPTTAPDASSAQPSSLQQSAPPQTTAQVASGQSAVPNVVPVNPSPKLVGGLIVYGKRPASNIAGPNDPPVVYYAAIGPSTVTNRTNVSITAITSTNVTNLTASYGSQSISMGQIRPGEWQALFPFSTSAIAAVGAAQVPITITASRQDGAASSIVLPIGLVQ